MQYILSPSSGLEASPALLQLSSILLDKVSIFSYFHLCVFMMCTNHEAIFPKSIIFFVHVFEYRNIHTFLSFLRFEVFRFEVG